MSEATHKIAIAIPLKLYKRIKARAVKQKTSFSKVAADLLACGLFDIEESELYDEQQHVS